MRFPSLVALAGATLALVAPTALFAQALHAPRNALGEIVRITPPTGCEGAIPGDSSLLSGNARYQAYVCRTGSNSSFFLYDNLRRKNIPMFGLPLGFAEPVGVSEKGNFVAILSQVPIPPGSEAVEGDWALYLFSRQTQQTVKILEDDPEEFGDIFGDNLCPPNDITEFGDPEVVHVDNRGRTLVRLDERATAGGPCPGGAYFELRP
jgi:hypothetical protein